VNQLSPKKAAQKERKRKMSEFNYRQKSMTEVDEHLLVRDIESLESDVQRISRRIAEQGLKIQGVEDAYFSRKSVYEKSKAEIQLLQKSRSDTMENLNSIAFVFEEMKRDQLKELAGRMQEQYRAQFYRVKLA
jgi:hypothetical protein